MGGSSGIVLGGTERWARVYIILLIGHYFWEGLAYGHPGYCPTVCVIDAELPAMFEFHG